MPPMTAPAKSMTLILGLSLGLHFPDQPVHHKISIVLYLRRLLALFNLREIIHDLIQRASAQLLAEDLGHDTVRERLDHIRTGGNHGLRDVLADGLGAALVRRILRSEEHTSELQSRVDLVCRLLLEKKKKQNTTQRGYLTE